MDNIVAVSSAIPSTIICLIAIWVFVHWMKTHQNLSWYAVPELWLIIHVVINTVIVSFARYYDLSSFSAWILIWGNVLRAHVVMTLVLKFFWGYGRKYA